MSRLLFSGALDVYFTGSMLFFLLGSIQKIWSSKYTYMYKLFYLTVRNGGI